MATIKIAKRDRNQTIAGRKSRFAMLQKDSRNLDAWSSCVYHATLLSWTFIFYTTSKFSQNHRKLKIGRDFQKSPSSTFCSKHSWLQNYTNIIEVLEIIKADNSKHLWATLWRFFFLMASHNFLYWNLIIASCPPIMHLWRIQLLPSVLWSGKFECEVKALKH